MGVEYITQPQVFLAPISAVSGILGATEAYPLLTTYQAWTSTAAINATVFPIPGNWVMINEPGSFIVTVGGVIQPPAEYSVNSTLRTLTFSTPVSAGVEIAGRQLATAAPSSQNFDFIKAVSATFTGTATINNLSGVTARFNSLTATNLTTTSLFVTNLTALSSVLNVVDITQIELSGFNITGGLSATSANINTVNSTNITLADTGSLVGATSATSINIGALSARTFSLIHEPANDGVDPILDIGETLTGSFSGFRIRYEELTNRFIGSSRTGTTILTSFIINTATGQVGISGLPSPGQALTVVGNISATGVISSQFGIPVSVTVPVDFKAATNTDYTVLTVPVNRFFIPNSLLGFVIERSLGPGGPQTVGVPMVSLRVSGPSARNLTASISACIGSGSSPYSNTNGGLNALSAGQYFYRANDPSNTDNLKSYATGNENVLLRFETNGYTNYTSLTGRVIVNGTLY